MKGQINDINEIHISLKRRDELKGKDSELLKGLKQSKPEFKIRTLRKKNIGILVLKHKTHVIDEELKKWVTSSAKNIFSHHPNESISLKVSNHQHSMSLNKEANKMVHDINTIASNNRNHYKDFSAQYKTSARTKKYFVTSEKDYRCKVKHLNKFQSIGTYHEHNRIINLNFNKKSTASIGLLSMKIEPCWNFFASTAMKLNDKPGNKREDCFSNKLSKDTKLKILLKTISNDKENTGK